MNQKRTLGEGNVTIRLIDGTEFVLKPSLHAIRTLSRRHDGLKSIMDKIGRYDFDTVLEVIEVGAQVNNLKEREELAQKVFETGFSDDYRIAADCISYVGILMNGGRLLQPREDREADKTDANPQTG